MEPDEAARQVAARVERELGFRAVETRRMHGGNNLLLILIDADGRRLLAKVYQSDDARHRDRLGREYRALSFLRRAGFDDVPCPCLRCDELRCGVYSFEEGCHRRASELTAADVERLVDFLLRLESLGPPVPEPALPPDEGGSAPPADRLAGFRATLEQFRAWASAADALPASRDALDGRALALPASWRAVDGSALALPASWRAVDGPGLALPALRSAVDGRALAAAEAALDALARDCAADPLASAPLPREALRFSQGDFGRHNALFRDDAPPCIVDFEYAHWADPAWVVANFVHHDANSGLAPAVRDSFLEAYRQGARLDAAARLPLLLRLANFAWVVEHLAGTRPDRLRIGAETTPGFDPDAYVADHLRQFEARLAAYLDGYPARS